MGVALDVRLIVLAMVSVAAVIREVDQRVSFQACLQKEG